MNNRCFIIAEAGVNHNGSLELAKEMVAVAKQAGADAVKFQTFTAESLTTASAAKAAYQTECANPGESQQEMLRELELSFDAFRELRDTCREQEIEFLSTAFDEESADFLNSLGMARFKIPSGEATNLRLIKRIAAYGKPIVLSTGMCTLEEVGRALDWINEVNRDCPVWLLQCVSAYPARPEDVNLRAMETMQRAFGVPAGLSDHTAGYAVALGAAALGAVAIEKHFTLDRTMKGPDHRSSLEPDELRAMVAGIREVEAALGDGQKRPTQAELEVANVARRSIVAARDLAAGAVLTETDLAFKRPGTGVEPRRFPEFVGRILKPSVAHDTLLTWSMVE